MFLKVEVSAETKDQANEILNVLLDRKLVAGAAIIDAPSKFWWKGKLEEMTYYTISGFTLDSNKKAIIEVVEVLSKEEVPMIWFFEMDGNKKLLDWVSESLS